MRNYIILNGVNSNTITGLLISKLPPITKPKIRTQTEEIDGRDGDIVTKLGYSAYDKEIEIGLYGNFDINEVIAYFNTEGTIVFSNEADKYYNYQILDQIDYEKLIRFKTAKVKMHVQPFKYPLEETPVEINIQNVTGSGEAVDINNTADAPITLALKGNTSQDGTPTPEAPVEVQTVTGRQEIIIGGINKIGLQNGTYTNGNVTFNVNNGVIEFAGTTDTSTRVFYIPLVKQITLKNGQINTLYIKTIGTTNSQIAVRLTKGQNASDSNSFARTYLTARKDQTNSVTYTQTADETFTHLLIQFNANQTVNFKSYIQLNSGNTVIDYAPYQSQSYELDLGKNMLDLSNLTTKTANGVTITKNEDGSVTINGTATSPTTFDIELPSIVTFQSGVTYKHSQGTKTSISSQYSLSLRQANYYPVTNSSIDSGSSSVTFTPSTAEQMKYYRIFIPNGITLNNQKIYPMVEKGDTASSFAPYKTPIEVCKIGDYQDYFFKDNNKWYIKRQVGKYTFTGTELWTQATNSNYNYFIYYLTATSYFTNYARISGNTTISNKYKGGNNAGGTTSVFSQGNYICCFRYNTGDTQNTFFITSSSSNTTTIKEEVKDTEVYYVLADPEDEEITDNTLIGQLNALENARSYDTTTNINQNTANKPFIINATAVQKGSDTGNVDNIGNIYAKPTIDIEGSGIVEIYLDGNQIFNVDLSTINECVIDTTNLEAYNPATTQLMNRQVTGDYSNFKINVGDNQVKVSGAVTKATISNYTRWL